MALDDWFGARSFRPFTVTIAAPGVISSALHGLLKNDKITLTTTGALPTGFSVDTWYYVIEGTYSDGSADPDTFKLTATKDGSAITTSGSQSGQHFYAANKLSRMTPAYADNH